MVIGIDIRVLGSRVKSGIEEYTENLLAHMIPLDKSVKFRLFYSSFGRDLNSYDWLLGQNVEVHKFRLSNKSLFLSSNIINFPKIDKLLGGVDVFFSPHFFIAPLSGSCKRVTTFHDLSFAQFPEFFSLRKNIWHNFQMKPLWQSKFSDKIIAVSESTKEDLMNIYNIDPGKIEVIYSGISPTIRRPAEDELKLFRSANSLPSDFILSLGKLEPRKNTVGVIRAFNIIKKEKRFNDLSLVIAGSRGWLDSDIFREAEKSDYKDKIIFKEKISDEDRKFYYSLASVFVYPSFFEGFGFPPLEAMACGTPVVTSSNTSLPEVVGRGGTLIDPHNISEIASVISTILRDNEISRRLVSEGISQASKFSWRNTAERTLSCLVK